MACIQDILENFIKHHPKGDTSIIQRSYLYASLQHDGQLRKSGQPYMMHPIAVANIVAEMGLCEPSICAALLHDTIEDTSTTHDELAEKFGENVANLVEGLTKLDKVKFVQREERQAESFRKMLIATVKDIRVLLIKLADRLHNMSTLEHLNKSKQERIAQETRDIYAPLANRLGISWLKNDLDDMSFKYLEPQLYSSLVKTIAKSKKTSSAHIDRIKKTLHGFVAASGYETTVSGRLKSLYSISQKMKTKGIEYDEVYDAIAFRIICKTVSDCYAILGLIHAKWVPVPGRIKDYIAMEKPNHYQSLHTTVVGVDGERMEVQLRTESMHKIAEYGIAAHWVYKKGAAADNTFTWLKDILDNQDGVDNSSEFLDSLKIDLFNDEVFVFTPKGETKVLKNGSTPLDFAYAIHTEVGNRCTGARVNGVLVSISKKLKNGDWPEIITSKNQRPSKTWLDIAVSSKARNKIRAYLRTEKRIQSVLAGRDILEKKLRSYGCSFQRMQKSGEIDKVATSFKLNTGDDLLAAIGYGKLDETAVSSQLIPENKRKDLPLEIKESTFEKVIRKVKWQDDGILLDGVEDLFVRFARCCNPLPGEPVLGYVSRGRGIIVHRRSCSNAALLEQNSQIRVHWSTTAVSIRPVKLEIITSNKVGILADLSLSFQNKDINITAVHCDTHDTEQSVNTFTFYVKNIAQLNELTKTLYQMKSVFNIKRLYN